MFRFTSEPEGSTDMLSVGSREIVQLQIHSSMFLLLEGPIHVVMGNHSIFYN